MSGVYEHTIASTNFVSIRNIPRSADDYSLSARNDTCSPLTQMLMWALNEPKFTDVFGKYAFSGVYIHTIASTNLISIRNIPRSAGDYSLSARNDTCSPLTQVLMWARK